MRSAAAISGRPSAPGRRARRPARRAPAARRPRRAGACRRRGAAAAGAARSSRSGAARFAARQPLDLRAQLRVVAVERLAGSATAVASVPAPAPEPPHARHGIGGSADRARAGAPTTVAPGGTSSTTTALAPIVAPAPIRTGPMTLAPVPMVDAGLDRRARGRRPRAARSSRTARSPRPRRSRRARRSRPGRGEVHAGRDHDRVADRDLRDRHRQPVREPRQSGTPRACRRAFTR